MPQNKILLHPKKSAFSKILIVMKCFKYSIYVWLNIYWTAKAWLKTRRKELPGHPLLTNGNSVNLSFYLNHYYSHIYKQILEYIFPKQIHWVLGCSLDKSVYFTNFAAVNNLNIVLYTALTKADYLLLWFYQ